MKYYISSAKQVTTQSLEEYVGLPFDLNNEEVQYKIAEWALHKTIEDLKNKRGLKKYNFWADDLSWSKSKIYFVVMEGDSNVIDEFYGRLNFYDEASEDYEDVEYLLNGDIRELVNNIYYDYR